jgi:hypothetical protein
VLLAGGAIAGAITMLALAPRSGASAPTSAIFVTKPDCDSVTTYPAGASGDVAPLSPGTGLCDPEGVAVDSKGMRSGVGSKIRRRMVLSTTSPRLQRLSSECR